MYSAICSLNRILKFYKYIKHTLVKFELFSSLENAFHSYFNKVTKLFMCTARREWGQWCMCIRQSSLSTNGVRIKCFCWAEGNHIRVYQADILYVS